MTSSIAPIFKKIETEIMKILSRNPGNYVNQFDLYNQILEEFEIKDPVEKTDFKMKFLIVLRQLSSTFNNISIKNEKDIFSAGLFIKDDFNITVNDTEPTDSSIEEHIDDTFDDLLLRRKNNNSNNMPFDIAVVNFIVDENMYDYFNKRDYLGNSILHNLAMANDYERIKKIYSRNDISFQDENNEQLTPLHYIQDVKIACLAIDKLMIENYDHAMELHKIGVHIKYMEEKMDYMSKMIHDNIINLDKQREIIFISYCVSCTVSAVLFLMIFYFK
jgi:hypothetical protein